MSFIDCHAHIFSNEHVPNKFLGLKLTLTDRLLLKLSGWVDWFSGSRLDNITSFAELLAMSPAEKLRKLFSYYPADSMVCVNLMDMRAIKGKIETDYVAQRGEMYELKHSKEFNGRIKIFLHVDTNFFFPVFESFMIPLYDGIKLYPPLSGNPALDPKLDKLFAFAEAWQIPITTHCGPFGVSAGSFWNMSKGANADPKHWETILAKYPRLKVNFAHFGEGNPAWQTKIVYLMQQYENVYTDTSFSLTSELFDRQLGMYLRLFPFFKERLLYGSDFFMVNLLDSNLQNILKNLRYHLGEDTYKQITEVNPAKFLERK